MWKLVCHALFISTVRLVKGNVEVITHSHHALFISTVRLVKGQSSCPVYFHSETREGKCGS
ncbi:hypothetical protein DPMN_077369 [Dreissena polymorpha]|uniref:Uncharacterized protein n=1 Tax=Dreissena polymorpha TaxID=45954 RepID=A0A9D3YP59_DREPO|nr:hypothetical protein DPMN_077369 [Dreissena polymorpha]